MLLNCPGYIICGEMHTLEVYCGVNCRIIGLSGIYQNVFVSLTVQSEDYHSNLTKLRLINELIIIAYNLFNFVSCIFI